MKKLPKNLTSGTPPVPPSFNFRESDADLLIDQDFSLIGGDVNADHFWWSDKALNRQREKLWEKIMTQLGLVTVFKNIGTVLNNKSEWAGNPDVILLRPNTSFARFTRPCIADHKILGIEILDFEKSGIGEQKSNTPKKFIDYQKLDPIQVKQFWESRILNLGKPMSDIRFHDLIKISEEIIEEVESPFVENTNSESFEQFLENSESISEFWQHACDAVDTNLWDVVTSLKKAEKDNSTPELNKTVKSKTIVNKFGKSVPIKSMSGEIFQHFKKDCKVERGDMLSGKRARWVEMKLNEAKPSDLKLEKIDIIRALKCLKNSCSPGLDRLKPVLLPCNSAIFINALTVVIQRAFQECKFPKTLKNGKLVFFVKPSKADKDKLSVKDLRGITLSKIFLKIIDHVIKDKLTTHLEKTNLRANHVGFRVNRGVTDNFGTLLSNIRKNQEKKWVNMLLLLDLSSAYNRISHSILLEKLLKAGVCSQLVKFIKFWLGNRTLNFETFIIVLGVSGLPQGSPVSPILFIFYCDFELSAKHKLNVKFYVYADDSGFQIRHKTWSEVDECALEVLKEFSSWSRANGLTLSEEKTECISFNRTKKSSFEQLARYEKSVVRYLGIYLDKTLSFKHHIEVILRPKLVGLLYALKYISRFTRLQFRRSFLFSILQNLFWPLFYIVGLSNCQKTNLNTWYNKFCRACVRAPDFVDTLTCQEIIGIESFEKLVNRQVMTKLMTISARESFYEQNDIANSECDFKEIFTPYKPENYHQQSYSLRHTRTDNPFRLRKKLIQNELSDMINQNLDYQELPWIKNPEHFRGRWWGTVRFDARESIEFLNQKRRDLIKSSLYHLTLTKQNNLKNENIEISLFIESKRNRWNFIPEALQENEYSIG